MLQVTHQHKKGKDHYLHYADEETEMWTDQTFISSSATDPLKVSGLLVYCSSYCNGLMPAT